MSYEDNFNDYLQHEKSNICHKIAFYKIENKLSFTKLSEKTGISVAELDAYELGTCEFDLNKLCKIGFAFGVGLMDLVRS